MPLTFAHPAIVLPAKYLPQRWVSMTGLIVGSVTPDFEYFMRAKLQSSYSHTWTGMFWFDLPLALLLTFLYHYIVRNQFIINSPVFLRKRLSRYMDFDWGKYVKHNFLTVLVCLLAGIASHIFWDSFTHRHGDFVKLIPFLRETTAIMGFHMVNYAHMQDISTVVGGVIVFYAMMLIPTDVNYARPRNPAYYWLIVIAAGLIIAGLRVLAGVHYWQYFNVATAFVSGLIAGSIIAPLILGQRIVKV